MGPMSKSILIKGLPSRFVKGLLGPAGVGSAVGVALEKQYSLL